MDRGTLTDANGRETDFRNVIIIMTTNAGARELMQGSIGFGREVGIAAGESQAIKDTFSPEFRNRLDAVISFDPLSLEIIALVVDKFVTDLSQKLAKQKVVIELTPSARLWLANNGYDPVYGARPLYRLIQDKVKKPLADELLFGQLATGGKVCIDVNGDRLTFVYDGRVKEVAS